MSNKPDLLEVYTDNDGAQSAAKEWRESQRTIRVRIVKGSKSLDISKDSVVRNAYVEATDLGVRVTFLGQYYYLNGNRKHLPKFEAGQRYNMHRTIAAEYITIEIK